MQKQSAPEVPQGLTPALNIFLRWVRDRLKGLAVEKAQETADSATSKAKKAQGTADSATDAAGKAQETADNAQASADTADGKAERAQQAAEQAQASADDAGAAADMAKKKADAAQWTADEAAKTASSAKRIARQAVRYTSQSLNADQQAQARSNIDAAQDVMATTSTGGQVIIGDGLGVNASGKISVAGSYATSANVSSILSDGGYVTSTYVSGATVAKAGVADQIGTGSVGNAAQPVYISSGKPKAISYTISKNVPADAVFTDTTYPSGTVAQLSAGTDTSARVYTPKVIHDYISSGGYVTSSGEQTIQGAFTFTGSNSDGAGIRVSRVNPYVDLYETDIERSVGVDSGGTSWQGLRFHDKKGNQIGSVIGTIGYGGGANKITTVRLIALDGSVASGGTEQSLLLVNSAGSGYIVAPTVVANGGVTISGSESTLSFPQRGINIPAVADSNTSKFLKGDGTWANVASAASAGIITSTLPVSLGGTGKTAFTNVNGVITAAGTSTGALSAVATKNGALYATSADGTCSFGTLPIAQGGTGQTSRIDALRALTSQSVGTSATHFLTITSDWSKGGYTAANDAKTVLGVPKGGIKHGSATLYTSGTTVSAGANVNISATFSPAFGGVPTVVGIARGGNNSYALYNNVSVYSVTSAQVVFRVRNVVSAYTASAASYIEWIAMYN